MSLRTRRLLAIPLLGIAHTLLRLANFLLDLTFYLARRVARDLADPFLDGTLYFLGNAADLIVIHNMLRLCVGLDR